MASELVSLGGIGTDTAVCAGCGRGEIPVLCAEYTQCSGGLVLNLELHRGGYPGLREVWYKPKVGAPN